MARGDILGGSAFRSATLSVVIVLLGISIAGAFCYVTVRKALYSSLEAQLVEEAILFRDLYRQGGVGSLREAVQKLDDPDLHASRDVMLLDPDGNRLAGTLNVAPAVVGVSRTLQFVPDREGHEVALRTTALDRTILVVGRSTAQVHETLEKLVVALFAASAMILLIVIVTGWTLSKRSLQRLDRISRALEAVSRGDLSARTGPMRGDGQIERISRLIDQSLDRLSTLVESSQNTIRAIAHDLRSPLNRAAIRMEEAAAAPAETREMLLADAMEELHRVGRIFDTVLRISSIEQATGKANFRPVDLGALAEEVLALFEADLAEKNQTCRIEIGEPVTVEGDEPALLQMLVNLLANAHKHTPAGARIVVRVRRDGEAALLEVCDNGAGIAAEERAEVLKPFVRLDRSRSQEGSGLGLALVQAVATRHGATVTLTDNAPGLCVSVRFVKSRKLQENL